MGMERGVRWGSEYRLLLALREHGPLAKRELGEICQLSRPTVEKVLRELEAQGLVRQDGYRESRSGRRPALYSFNDRAKYALGIDLEMPKLNIVLSDLNGQPLWRRSSRIAAVEDPRVALKVIVEEIRHLLAEVGLAPEKLIGAGFGAPAFLQDGAITISGRTLPRWTAVPVKRLLEEALGVPVQVDNDVKFMALAESHNAGYDDEVLVYCALRRGLRDEVRMGASALIRGEIFRGAHGNAGSLQDAYVELPDGLTRALSQAPGEALDRLEAVLLEPLAHMVMLFDPQHLVINAAVLGEYGDEFLERCEAALQERLSEVFTWKFQLVAARDRELTCAKGAALFVIQDLFSRPQELLARLI